jgi:hypothetical protein
MVIPVCQAPVDNFAKSAMPSCIQEKETSLRRHYVGSFVMAVPSQMEKAAKISLAEDDTSIWLNISTLAMDIRLNTPPEATKLRHILFLSFSLSLFPKNFYCFYSHLLPDRRPQPALTAP